MGRPLRIEFDGAWHHVARQYGPSGHKVYVDGTLVAKGNKIDSQFTWETNLEIGWANYGGYFNGHPWSEEVGVKVEDRKHPATCHLPKKFKVLEEVYTFKKWDRKKTRVLISLDNKTVDISKGNRKDNDYAMAWCHDYGKGRVFYTGFGHYDELWYKVWFRQHLIGGIRWAAKEE